MQTQVINMFCYDKMQFSHELSHLMYIVFNVNNFKHVQNK